MGKSFGLLFGLLLSMPSFAFYQADIIDGKVVTDEIARELGLTPLEDSDFEKGARKALTKRAPVNEPWKNGPDKDKAEVVIIIDKAEKGSSPTAQTMKVYYKGDLLHDWKVSTGKETLVTATSGKKYITSTPLGYYRPTTIWKTYESTTWVGASMDFPIFFIGGIAIHATTPGNYDMLGSRASGGCIRLHRSNAEDLNELVLGTGLDSYEIRPANRQVDDRVITRHQVVGGKKKVLGVYRDTGVIYNETMVNSWDTLIVVKDLSKK